MEFYILCAMKSMSSVWYGWAGSRFQDVRATEVLSVCWIPASRLDGRRTARNFPFTDSTQKLPTSI